MNEPDVKHDRKKVFVKESMKNYTVHSPMVTGSGAYIVHATLAKSIQNYSITPIDPKVASLPFLLKKYKTDHDIIHSAPDFGSQLYTKECKAVTTFHSYNLDQESLNHASFAQKVFYKTILTHAIRNGVARADAITAVSNFTADMVTRHFGYNKKIHVIKNGIDENRFKPTTDENLSTQCRILFVGNMLRRKGATLLTEMVDHLPKSCHIAYTSGLRTKSDKIRDHRLVNLGRIPYEEIHKVYQSADILIFPTVREGLGLAAIEAMACGLPVVTTNCSALPEVVDHAKGGYLCGINNIAEMISYLKTLIDNPELRAEMGQHNREKVLKEFTLKKMLTLYNELFNELMG